MGEIVSLFQVGYPHVVCSSCGGDTFYIKTFEDDNGTYFFGWLVCANPECSNEIELNLQPAWPPTGDE